MPKTEKIPDCWNPASGFQIPDAEASISNHPILAHISTEQACYFATLSSAALRLALLSVLDCSVLRKILLVALMG